MVDNNSYNVKPPPAEGQPQMSKGEQSTDNRKAFKSYPTLTKDFMASLIKGKETEDSFAARFNSCRGIVLAISLAYIAGFALYCYFNLGERCEKETCSEPNFVKKVARVIYE